MTAKFRTTRKEGNTNTNNGLRIDGKAIEQGLGIDLTYMEMGWDNGDRKNNYGFHRKVKR